MPKIGIPGALSGQFNGGNYLPPAAGAAAAALTTLNIANATKTDPNDVLAAETSLGTTSNIVADTNHGKIGDAGLDPAQLMTDIGSIPSDTNLLHVRFYVGTIPTEDPGGSACTLEIFVAPSNTIATNEGYHTGFSQ